MGEASTETSRQRPEVGMVGDHQRQSSPGSSPALCAQSQIHTRHAFLLAPTKIAPPSAGIKTKWSWPRRRVARPVPSAAGAIASRGNRNPQAAIRIG